ncbi:MAG: hypothetical protein EAZ85_15115 [Bacteroidetes bacterium]|nr:MAG: hypothetical protein EAZ85_15115 [Bacteroidota bacterium]TAG88910.1 MAG: hypothetical protein EAZ20_07580 [Bacteroidota bacterium]
MKLLPIIICFFCGCFFTINKLKAQTTPIYSNEFLNIGVGGRALAMGNTQVGIVKDVTAGYWNPAGLLGIKKRYEAALMHSEHFGGIAKYDFASFATRVDSNSCIGITAIRFGIDDIPDTRFLYDANGNINYNNVKFFSAADYGFLVTYSRRIKGWELGGNFKIIYRNAGNFANAFGFGIDAGIQRKFGTWQLGLLLRDVSTTFNTWTHNTSLLYDVYTQTGNQIPRTSTELTLPRAILGVGKNLKLSKDINMLLAFDAAITSDGRRNTLLANDYFSLSPSLGMELDYQKIVFLRAGANQYQKIKNFDGTQYAQAQYSFGLGVVIKDFSIDYALTRNNTDKTTNALYSNIFSIKFSFDKL